jgi:pre-mRNA-splicing factor SYF1
MFLDENNYFEEAFKAYEKGIALFKWPNVYDIWNTYLIKFIERYGGKKLERARDLFEQCLEGCPPTYAKPIYLMYAKLEEDHGLPRRALDKYDRATRVVLPEDRYEMFNTYIENAKKLYGVTHTREIYQQAIEVLDDENARKMCLRFAELENKLGEIDRARAIYAHCSQICDPRVTVEFWNTWKDFEVKHGNEDTVREMLRVKRSVQAMYNTQVNFMSAQMLSAQSLKQAAQEAAEDRNEMKILEEKARELAEESAQDLPKAGSKGIQFIRSNATHEELGQLTKTNNPEEINIDEDVSDDDEAIEEIHLQKKAIPTEVFGDLVQDD